MKYNIPLPRVLDTNGNELRRLNVIDASVSLSLEPLSTAQIVLPIFENLNMREWVQMFTSQGSVGVFRVRSPGQNYRMESKQYALDHGIVELGDYVIKGEVELNAAADSVITSIFSHYSGNMWKLGTIATQKAVQYSGKYEDILTALMSVMNQLPEYMMDFDQTQLPWTLNIVSRPKTISGEGRLGRNIVSARVSEDDTGLCTRLLSPDLPNGKLEADTIGLYGVVEQFVSKDEEQSQEKFVSDCTEYLAQHKNPLLSITIDLCDLEQVTGEPLDGIKLGSLYRLALPDYNATYDQAVIHMQYTSVYGSPGRVMVTLANEEKTMSSVFHDASASSASAQKKQEKVNDQFGGAIKGNTEQLTIQSKKIDVVTHDLTVTAGDLNTVKLQVNDQGIRLSAEETATVDMNKRIESAEISINAQGVRISANETNIDLLSETQTDQAASIEVMSGKIESKASQSEVDTLGNRVTTAESNITQNAKDITLKVSNGKVASQLSVECGNVTISQSEGKVNLVVAGYITADELEALMGDFKGTVSAPTVSGGSVWANSNFYFKNSAVSSHGAKFNGAMKFTYLTTATEDADITYADLPHYHEITATPNSDGTVTLTLGAVQDSPGTDSFNMADTAWYAGRVSAFKTAVSSALGSAAWTSSGSASTIIDVSLDTANKQLRVNSAVANITYPGDDKTTPVSITLPGVLSFDTELTNYANAQRNAVKIVQQDTAGWVNGKYVVKTDAPTPQTYTVSLPTFSTSGGTSFTDHKTTVYFSTPSVSGPLTQVEVDATDEYKDGQNSVNVVKGAWNGGRISFTTSQGSGAGASIELSATPSWGEGYRCSVPIMDGGYSTGYTVNVNGYDNAYVPGWNNGWNGCLEKRTSLVVTSNNVPYYPPEGSTGFKEVIANINIPAQRVATSVSVTSDASMSGTGRWYASVKVSYDDSNSTSLSAEVSRVYYQAYRSGWNAAIDAATGYSCLTGYYEWQYRDLERLYYNDGSAWKTATGNSQRWVYGGTEVTLYTLPNKMTS